MLIVKHFSHSLHQDVNSAGKFLWFASGKEPVLFPKDMLIGTRVLLRVVHPSLSLPEFVLGINDDSPQVCVSFNPVLSITSISLPLLVDPTLSTGEVWSRREKMCP